MLIGELARRTGVSTRLLRYYEEQELLVSRRGANGYRSFSGDAPERVGQIRELLAAGLPTKAIRELMPCSTGDGMQHCDRSRSVLNGGLERLDEQIEELSRKRRLLAGQAAAAMDHPSEP